MAEPKLVRYDAMVAAIERAASVDEVKEIRAKAIALEAYAKVATNKENERKCSQIRIRAERRCGELLREMKGKERHSGHGDQKSESRHATPKLTDLGVTKDQSSDWQHLAAIPKEKFEDELKKPGIPSTEDVLRSAYPKKREPSPIANVHPSALDMWGRLLDFERYGFLELDPNELFATMTEPMREDVLRLIPVVISWLDRLDGGNDGIHRKTKLADPGTLQPTGCAKENRDLP